MAATIQNIELPKKPRALDSSTSVQEISQELLRNADFSANESANQTFLNGGLQFDDWEEQQSSGLREFTTVIGGIRCTAETETTSTWHQRIYQTLDASFRFNVQQTNSTDDQWAPENYNVEADVDRTIEVVYTCTDATTQHLIFFPTVILTAGQYYEVKNVSLKEVESFSNNNHGKIYSGRALEFDGVSDYFQSNGGTSLTGVNSFADGTAWTLACWMSFGDVVSGSDDYCIGKDYASHPTLIYANGALEIRDANGNYFRFAGVTLARNTWYRVVIVTDGISLTAYINGVLYGVISDNQAEEAAHGSANFSTTEMQFTGWGMPYQNGGVRANGFMGMMSDGQVWDATWSAADAAYDYANPESLALNASGTALTEGNLKVWYPMQDGHRGQQSYILDGASTDSNTGPSIVHHSENFSTDTTGTNWAVNDASSVISHDSANNLLRVTYAESDGNELKRNSTLTIGKKYKVTFKARGTHDSAFISIGSTGVFGAAKNPVLTTFFQDYERNFVADSGAFRMYQSDDATAGEYLEVTDIVIKAINDKHHATTVFYGDMTDLCTDDNSNFGKLYNTANTEFDFTKESTAFAGGDGYDVLANSAFSVDNISALIETDNSATGLRLANTASAKGGTRSGALATVVGRTYELDVTHYATSESYVDVDIYILVGTEAGGAQLVNATNSDGTYSVTFVATTTSIHLTFGPNNTVSGNSVRIKTIQLREVGVASGWTDADQQLHIPQTALQSYNELAWSLPTTGGNMMATVPHNADFNINSSDFTANFWVYLNDHGFGGGQYVFHKGGGGSEGWHIRIKADGQVDFVVHDGGAGGDGVSVATANSGVDVIKEGQWHMITGVVDHANTVALYIDGVLIESTAFPSDDNDIYGSGYLEMFNWSSTYSNGTLNGTATEFSIFKGVAFSATEVVELHNDGKALDATTHSQITNLKGYWRNNGLNTTWKNINNPGTHDATFSNGSETLLIPQGVDGSRDAQGFIMNRARNTSSLNFPVDKSSQTPSLDTGSYVEVGDHSGLTFGTGNFSMECWVKPSYRSKGSSSLNTIFTLGGQINDSDSAGLCTSSGSILAYIGGVSMSEGYSSNNWYHVVATREGLGSGEMKLYVNGAEEATGTSVNGTDKSININNAHNMTIGAEDNRTRGYEEAVDSIKVYNKALDETEVLRNYKATKGSHRN